MSLHDHSEHKHQPEGSLFGSRAGLVLIGFIIIAGALLFTEHRAHVLGALFWVLPFACIFMHMFMHGGHGGHGGHSQPPRDRSVS